MQLEEMLPSRIFVARLDIDLRTSSITAGFANREKSIADARVRWIQSLTLIKR